MLCPGTCIFGPWTSFNDYLSIYKQPQWNFKWLRRIINSFLLAILFLSISTCWCHYVIPDDSWKWFTSYRYFKFKTQIHLSKKKNLQLFFFAGMHFHSEQATILCLIYQKLHPFCLVILQLILMSTSYQFLGLIT